MVRLSIVTSASESSAQSTDLYCSSPAPFTNLLNAIHHAIQQTHHFI